MVTPPQKQQLDAAIRKASQKSKRLQRIAEDGTIKHKARVSQDAWDKHFADLEDASREAREAQDELEKVYEGIMGIKL